MSFYLFLSNGFYLSFAFLPFFRGENYHRLHCVSFEQLVLWNVTPVLKNKNKKLTFLQNIGQGLLHNVFPLSFITACNPPSMTSKMKKDFPFCQN